MRRPTQAQVDRAASYLHSCRMAWGEHNLATVRAYSTWHYLNEVRKEKAKKGVDFQAKGWHTGLMNSTTTQTNPKAAMLRKPNTIINPETGTQFSRAELKTAFEMVQNTTNWKNPLDAAIPNWAVDVVTEAVIFYAGCRPTITRLNKVNSNVKAVGYYAAVGA